MGYLQENVDAPEVQLDGAFAGTIATTAALVTDHVYVTVQAFSTDFRFGPCRWQPRVAPQIVNVAEGVEAVHNITVAQVKLPARGDRCLVVFDDAQQPWIVVWEPA